MLRVATVLVAAALAVAGAGLVSAADSGAEKAKRRGKPVRVVDSAFGEVIADKRGEALYVFGADGRGKSNCYGECARVWPPLLTRGRPRAIKGANPKLLGTTKRRDGKRQVTYRGRPLYYYVHDRPGRILCHDVVEFGGVWLLVRPNGRRVP